MMVADGETSVNGVVALVDFSGDDRAVGHIVPDYVTATDLAFVATEHSSDSGSRLTSSQRRYPGPCRHVPKRRYESVMAFGPVAVLEKKAQT